MSVQSKLQAGLLAGVSATAFLAGCGSGGTPPGSGSSKTAAIDCGDANDPNSFADYSPNNQAHLVPEEKQLLVDLNNALMKAQIAKGETLSCAIPPTAKLVDILDDTLPSGAYLWFSASMQPAYKNPYGTLIKNGIMMSIKAPDPDLPSGYYFLDTRGILWVNGTENLAISSRNYVGYNDGNIPYPAYITQYEEGPGTVQSFNLLKEVASQTGQTLYQDVADMSEHFNVGAYSVAPQRSGFPLTKDQIIGGLGAIKLDLNRDFGIGQNWDTTSFALISDPPSVQAGKQFLIAFDLFGSITDIRIRSSANMLSTNGDFEGIAISISGALDDTYNPPGAPGLKFYALTQAYNGPAQVGTAGAEAEGWIETINSFRPYSPTTHIFQCAPSCSNLSTPLSRISQGSLAPDLSKQLSLPAQTLGVRQIFVKSALKPTAGTLALN